MRIGLVSYRCISGNISFNLSQIERALRDVHGNADLLCFGEAFLQGFNCLCWDYETDKAIAVDHDSDAIARLKQLSVQYKTALLVGYIEKDEQSIYSSCIVIDKGKTVHNYRRISKGWKVFSITDRHYCEGNETGEFDLHGIKIMLALCGDLWEYPQRFKTDNLLIWPVYLNFERDEWENGLPADYARQAALAAKDTLMVNSIDYDPVSHGGSFRFQNGVVADRIALDEEDILIVDVS